MCVICMTRQKRGKSEKGQKRSKSAKVTSLRGGSQIQSDT